MIEIPTQHHLRNCWQDSVMFSAVVFTAGRAGSHLIVDNLVQYHNSKKRQWWDDSFQHGVVHSHNPLYHPPTSQFIGIVNTRRDEFSAMISMLLTRRTNEFTYYSNKNIIPFEIPKQEFRDVYHYFKCFYKSINLDAFKEIVEIEYESLINDPTYLFSKFGIRHNTVYNLKKSPYDYTKLVTNLDDIKKVYTKLIKTDISQEQVENFKISIVSDLEDIRLNHNGNRNA